MIPPVLVVVVLVSKTKDKGSKDMSWVAREEPTSLSTTSTS